MPFALFRDMAMEGGKTLAGRTLPLVFHECLAFMGSVQGTHGPAHLLRVHENA